MYGTNIYDGIVYIYVTIVKGASVKETLRYGNFLGMRNGRCFTDFTEESLKAFWGSATSLRIFDLWITRDVRQGREEERWINLLARRV